MVAYGVGLLGFIVSACLYLHITAKSIFVRVLRNSKHLQANTFVHWGTWLGTIATISTLAFILSEAIPIFNYLIALNGALCLSSLGISLPAWLWLYDHGSYRKGELWQKLWYAVHVIIIATGLLMVVGGMYSVIVQIQQAYANSEIRKFAVILKVYKILILWSRWSIQLR